MLGLKLSADLRGGVLRVGAVAGEPAAVDAVAAIGAWHAAAAFRVLRGLHLA